MDLYIYYRVAAASEMSLRDAVGRLQASLRQQHGVRCGLKQRPLAVDGRHTWMEIYLAVPTGFEADLDRAIVATELPTLIEGSRHTEYFVDCLPCA